MNIPVLCGVVLGGALGALSRYSLTTAAATFLGLNARWGTLGVNVLGCLLFGVFFQLFETRVGWRLEWRVAILTGFLGAFTTFSTYVCDLWQLVDSKRIGGALGFFFASNVLGVVALFVGLWLVKTLSRV